MKVYQKPQAIVARVDFAEHIVAYVFSETCTFTRHYHTDKNPECEVWGDACDCKDQIKVYTSPKD